MGAFVDLGDLGVAHDLVAAAKDARQAAQLVDGRDERRRGAAAGGRGAGCGSRQAGATRASGADQGGEEWTIWRRNCSVTMYVVPQAIGAMVASMVMRKDGKCLAGHESDPTST